MGQGNRPTGFHLIIPLNREISCSSVHGSANVSVIGLGSFTGLWVSFAGVALSSAADIVSAGVSADRVDAARDDKRAFFLGGMVESNQPWPSRDLLQCRTLAQCLRRHGVQSRRDAELSLAVRAPDRVSLEYLLLPSVFGSAFLVIAKAWRFELA